MAEQDIETVVAESRSIVEQLVGIQSRIALHLLPSASVDGGRVAAHRRSIVVILVDEHVVCYIGGELEVLEYLDVQIAS